MVLKVLDTKLCLRFDHLTNTAYGAVIRGLIMFSVSMFVPDISVFANYFDGHHSSFALSV